MKNKPALTEEQVQDWLLNPVTQTLHQVLRGWVEGRKEIWASGGYTDQSDFATTIMNAKAIGCCEVCESILDLDCEVINQEVELLNESHK